MNVFATSASALARRAVNRWQSRQLRTIFLRDPSGSILSTYARAFFVNRMRSLFLVKGVWPMARIFSEWQTNFSKFRIVVWQSSAVSELVKLKGKFFAKCCASATFCLAQKVW